MIIADTHLHIYENYNLAAAIGGCVQRLSGYEPEAVCAGFLVEREGQHIYRSMADGSAGRLLDGVDLEVLDGGHCLAMSAGGCEPLYLCPGRQIVTRERLEILCLGVDAAIADGLAADEAIARVLEVGGVAVLAWAVGKWLFKRAAVVRSLLDEFASRGLLVGDSAMRPVFWGEPRLMRYARRLDMRVLAGSDPLPASGEERVMGRYASLLQGKFEKATAGQDLREALISSKLQTVGRRSGPLEFLQRMSHS